MSNDESVNPVSKACIKVLQTQPSWRMPVQRLLVIVSGGLGVSTASVEVVLKTYDCFQISSNRVVSLELRKREEIPIAQAPETVSEGLVVAAASAPRDETNEKVGSNLKESTPLFEQAPEISSSPQNNVIVFERAKTTSPVYEQQKEECKPAVEETKSTNLNSFKEERETSHEGEAVPDKVISCPPTTVASTGKISQQDEEQQSHRIVSFVPQEFKPSDIRDDDDTHTEELSEQYYYHESNEKSAPTGQDGKLDNDEPMHDQEGNTPGLPRSPSPGPASNDIIKTRYGLHLDLTPPHLKDDFPKMSDYCQIIVDSIRLLEVFDVSILSPALQKGRRSLERSIAVHCRYCSDYDRCDKGSVMLPGSMRVLPFCVYGLTGRHLAKSCNRVPEAIKVELERTKIMSMRQSRSKNGLGLPKYLQSVCDHHRLVDDTVRNVMRRCP